MKAPARDCLAIVVLAFTLFGLLWLTGCSSVDREYGATYDITTGQTLATVKLTGGTGRRSASLGITGENVIRFSR